MKQLIEDINKFNEGFRHIIEHGGKEICMGCGLKKGGLKEVFNQFIDELIKVQNEQMQKELSVERFARPDFYKGYEASKNETIAHLKKLKEQLQ